MQNTQSRKINQTLPISQGYGRSKEQEKVKNQILLYPKNATQARYKKRNPKLESYIHGSKRKV